ncbi:MAG: hypothetical protein E7376_01015 [Clostridiales bacterium]|nr:hypothetical protein [Clostridiales bacterium]
MKKLNNTTDVVKYLKFGNLTQPFLKDEYVLEMVMRHYYAKIKLYGKANQLESLYLLINHNVKYSKNQEFRDNYKFQRTAEEIWASKQMTGCTDYCILFATLARQIGISTTFLHTAEKYWLQKFKNNETFKYHSGHSFCECFYKGKWILVDPTCKKIQTNYDSNNIQLNYNVGGKDNFIPYIRDLDLSTKQSISEHNKIMDELCLKI